MTPEEEEILDFNEQKVEQLHAELTATKDKLKKAEKIIKYYAEEIQNETFAKEFFTQWDRFWMFEGGEKARKYK
jgi:hypothetical protein